MGVRTAKLWKKEKNKIMTLDDLNIPHPIDLDVFINNKKVVLKTSSKDDNK